ncbi:MAG TPA: glycosyltransferase [Candidatus Angelobacter sp.]|jgi:glycosyltransferase involved in cell wall biosynthesis
MISDRKKILFLVPAFAGGIGGAERVISTLLRYLDHTRFECHLGLVLADSAFLEDVPGDVTVHYLRVKRIRYCLPGIIRLVWKIKPHTILSTVSYLNVMSIMARSFSPKRTRLLVREATMPSAFIAQDTAYPRLWEFLYRRLYRRADKIICLSDSMQRDFAEHFSVPPEKLTRIYNPIDIELIQQAVKGGRNPYQTRGPHLVAIGRLRREKGFDLLIAAFAEVVRKIPDAHLIILGEGPDAAALKEQARTCGLHHKIDFPGFVANPWLYLASADLFVLSSRMEGLPNTLLEALVLGTPIVASDCVGAMRELQSIDQRIVLFPTENSSAMAHAIISSLSANKLAGAGSKLISSSIEFEPSRVAEQYGRLF